LINILFLAVVYADLPYKLNIGEPWDTRFLTLDELIHILQSINIRNSAPFHVVILWINPSQLNVVTEALEETGHDNIMTMYWHKVGNRPPVPAHRLASITEQCVIAYSKGTTQYSNYLNLPTDVLQRGNMIMSRGLGVLSKNVSGEEINRFEKPPWVSQQLIAMFTKPGAEVLVLGSGAGGDVKGILNAGRDCLAIESDTKQYDAMVAHMLEYKPVCQLEEIIHSEEVVNARKAARDEAFQSNNGLCEGCLPMSKNMDTRRCPSCAFWWCAHHWPFIHGKDPFCTECVTKAGKKKAAEAKEKGPEEKPANPPVAEENAEAPSE
jgi:hypothetical protein